MGVVLGYAGSRKNYQIGNGEYTEAGSEGDGYMVPIGVSARHVHLTQADLEVLFGPGLSAYQKEGADGRSICIQ